MKNYFKILGVDPDVSETELKQRFRQLAFRYHPDQNDDPEAHQRFVEINEAYETLIDPQKRVLYKYRLLRWQNQNNPPNAGNFESADSSVYPYPGTFRRASTPPPPRQPQIHPVFHTTARIARLLSIGTLLLGLVLSVDFFWQEQVDQLRVTRVDLLPPTARRSVWTMDVQTEQGTFPMSPFLEETVQAGDLISIRRSHLFNVVNRVGIPAVDGSYRWFRPHVGIYGPPFLFVVLMIGISIATWRKPKNIMIPTFLGILLIFLAIICLGILRNS